MTDLEIRILDDPREQRRVHDLFTQVWGTTTSVVGADLIRAIGHAGGYVAAAYADGNVVGGSLGFLGRHLGSPSLHSHVTGILPGVRRTGVGRAMKLHQREWAAERDLRWITWTFDPLVRRNAWFNIAVLGATVHEYLVDFYGPIGDAINGTDETDRLLAAWAVADDGATEDATDRRADPPSGAAPRPPVTGTRLVATPEDIVVLRRTDPADADAWRHRLRRELADPLAAGATVAGFTRQGDYVVVPAGGAS